MSTFEVKVRTIDVLQPHPNADKLELVVIGGYKAVVGKGIHQVGDKIVYVPEDSVFTNLEVAKLLQINDYLTGKEKNRVKAIRLRGILSQGIVLPWTAFKNTVDGVTTGTIGQIAALHPTWIANHTINGDIFSLPAWTDGEDWAEFLQLEKYEEPIPIEMAGQVRSWPTFLAKYDIENIKRPESFNALKEGEEVVMTEKLHGTNIAIAFGPGLEDGEVAYVCSSNRAIKYSETNVYWRAVRKFQLIDKLKEILDTAQMAHDMLGEPPIQTISLHGEVVGVQDLKYGFSNGDIGFFAFDLMINGEFVDYPRFLKLCKQVNIPVVTELYRGPYDYESVVKLAEGKTLHSGDHIREGGVIKPIVERYDTVAGRVNFKIISEAYLTRKGGSELH